MGELDEIVKEFLIESTENLDQLDRDLVQLEKHPESKDVLGSIFRTIHTLKGASGFLAFSKLESLAHVAENLLSLLRDGKLHLTPEITSALLRTVDAIRQMLAQVESTGTDGAGDYHELIELLKAQQTPAPAAAGTEPPKDSASAPKKPDEEEAEPKLMGEILLEKGLSSTTEIQAALKQQADGDPRRIGEILVEQGSIEPGAVREAIQGQQQAQGLAASDATIRVDVALLDKLMNLVGELVLARNQILQFSASQQDASFLGTTQRLNLITTELQEGVMKTRMQPIGNIWTKFPRVVRDLASGCSKQVRVEMQGRETELDKTLIEAIKDPLTHIVRNSVDHGIEPPEIRLARGKPAEGLLFLRAYHEGGQVNIEISDDGAGVDIAKVKKKAVQRGLITQAQAEQMSERESLNILFLPGFSTAETVTNVSGRGVGMDVVKTNIERIGGTVDLQSRPGHGTTLKIKIPLTLAIIPALIITCDGDRYAIPQVSLLELVRLAGEQARQGIEMIHDAPVHRLRGNLLPLVYLNRELQGDQPAGAENGAATRSSGNGSGRPLHSVTESLDFVSARNGHVLWISKLREFLGGRLSLDAEAAGANNKCAFGKWLYSNGMKQYGDIPQMQELERTHTAFHLQAKKIILLKNSNHAAECEQELSALEAISHHVVSLLTAVEELVAVSGVANIVVLQADDRQFGLVVDEINDTEEIVVKPLGKQLKGISAFAGSTIMGDGRVALILDVLGLAQRAKVVTETRDRGLADKESHAQEQSEDRQTLLLLRGPEDSRMAVPLSLVARLEEFDRKVIEKSNGRRVVQYRGEILPLIYVSEALVERRKLRRHPAPSAPVPIEEKSQVVVYSDGATSVGFVVEKILDIVETKVEKQQKLARAGTLGSAIIQGKVTELLDLEALIAASGVRNRNDLSLQEATA